MVRWSHKMLVSLFLCDIVLTFWRRSALQFFSLDFFVSYELALRVFDFGGFISFSFFYFSFSDSSGALRSPSSHLWVLFSIGSHTFFLLLGIHYLGRFEWLYYRHSLSTTLLIFLLRGDPSGTSIPEILQTSSHIHFCPSFLFSPLRAPIKMAHTVSASTFPYSKSWLPRLL